MRPADTEAELLFDRSPIAMYRSHEDGRLLAVNAAFIDLLGYTAREQVLALDLDRDVFVDPAQRPALDANGMRIRMRHRDGQELQVKAWCRATGPQQFLVWITDLTALAESRAEVKRTAIAIDTVMHLVSGIYWRVDTEQRVIEVGGAMQEVLGYTGPGRYVGKTIDEHAEVEPPSIHAGGYHQRALAGETVSFDSEYKGKQMAATLGPLHDADGKIIGALGIAIDVTRARQLERRMIDAQRAESLGVLAGGLAHDFNNLLVAVLGSAELALRDLKPGAPGRTAVENIRDAGLRAAELTNQLLAYAGRAGAGTSRIHPAEVVEELVRIVSPTLPDHVTVHVDIPGALALGGDPTQVRQVMLNLIANARDAIGSRGGSISIRGRALAHPGGSDAATVLAAPAGDYISLEVKDDGPGFDRETRSHVFEPFFTTKATGHGLGLAAVLGIVRAHGGGIRVISEPGRGATFEVLWPIASSRRAGSPAAASAGGGRTVLVIDDEDLVRDVVARMVEELGYAAVTAADGRSALAALEQHEVDAVLVDLSMPNMSGDEVVAAVRERRPGVPVVLCSGYDRDGRGPIAADAYLPKPFRIDALERTLAKLLPLRSV